MGGRISRSIQVAKESYEVLRSNPALTLFPILSGIATVIVSIPFLVPLVLAAMGSEASHHHVVFDALHWVITACWYFATYFVVVFFNAALVACANEQLNGRPATIAFGVDAAMKRLPQIIGWAAVASTVGVVLRFISERTGLIGTIITSLVGLVWNLAVFFVVPNLVLERVGPIDAIKSSTAMIKQTWGERIILGVGMGSAVGIFVLLGFIPLVGAIALLASDAFVLGFALLALTVIYFIALGIVSSALTTIFQTALFLYCRTGVVPNGFQASSIQGAFREKPVNKVFGRSF